MWEIIDPKIAHRAGTRTLGGPSWLLAVWLLVVSLPVIAGYGCARSPDPAAPPPLRVMPLGDSITQGAPGNPGYRIWLWRRIRDHQLKADFVGSQKHYFMSRFRDWRFDSDHEGHWGISAQNLPSKIIPALGRHRPDAVLLHVGTNDLFQGHPIETIVRDLAAIIARCRQANPRAFIYLAQIIPVDDPQAIPRVAALNREIAALGARLHTPQSPVVVVDHFTGFDPAVDTYDGIHPNRSGAIKMADRWWESLQPQLRAAAQ